MTARIEAVTRDFPWYVYEESGEITAYAYLHYYHSRRAYRYTAEDSIYVKKGCQNKGIGKKLLALLIADAGRLGLHTIMALLGLPNEASERLHRAAGFEHIADVPELGFKFGEWVGVGYWMRRGEKKVR
jgi:phosphinothricin acetyltransferase